MNLKLECLFKAKGEVKETSNGSLTRFYCDIDTDTQYPGVVEFQFFNDKVDVDKLKTGQKITVNFNINGRKWTNPEGKSMFFQSLVAWKIESDSEPVKESQGSDESELPISNESDDLPF